MTRRDGWFGLVWALFAVLRSAPVGGSRLVSPPGGGRWRSMLIGAPARRHRALLRQLAFALEHCHAHAIAHRDLKVGSSNDVSHKDWLPSPLRVTATCTATLSPRTSSSPARCGCARASRSATLGCARACRPAARGRKRELASPSLGGAAARESRLEREPHLPRFATPRLSRSD